MRENNARRCIYPPHEAEGVCAYICSTNGHIITDEDGRGLTRLQRVASGGCLREQHDGDMKVLKSEVWQRVPLKKLGACPD